MGLINDITLNNSTLNTKDIHFAYTFRINIPTKDNRQFESSFPLFPFPKTATMSTIIYGYNITISSIIESHYFELEESAAWEEEEEQDESENERDRDKGDDEIEKIKRKIKIKIENRNRSQWE